MKIPTDNDLAKRFSIDFHKRTLTVQGSDGEIFEKKYSTVQTLLNSAAYIAKRLMECRAIEVFNTILKKWQEK